MRTFLIQALAIPAFAAMASAQVPAGSEFQVNTYTTGFQETSVSPGVRSAPNGDFIFVWRGNGPSGLGVWARRFDAAGASLGSEFRVDTSIGGTHFGSTVAVGGRGDFVVAWSHNPLYIGFADVYARRFDRAGSPQGLEFRVNTYTTLIQHEPSVAADRAGNFVVIWTGYGDDDASQRGVFGQRYDASGSPRGGEFLVNTYTTDHQITPSVAYDGAGNFVVAWNSRYQDGYFDGVFAQRFAADGTRRGSEFGVNTYTSGAEILPRVAADRAGNFVVVWTDYADGDQHGVMGRRYDEAGAPQGAEFRVNSYTTGRQWVSSVDSDESGNFVVTWMTDDQDGDLTGIFAQRFDAAGQRRGVEFRVNSYTPGEQLFTSVANNSAGNFSIVWSSAGDGDGFGVFAQRFGGLLPTALAVDASGGPTSDGNGVFEAGETVAVTPAWRNVNGAQQSFTGTAATFTGPGAPNDPTYTVVDDFANYGVVANGATSSCLATNDCFEVGLSTPTTRPAAHWDADLREDLVPDAQGQSKIWKLHVGESFSDVPRASGFYRFVETLLHHNVTSGCGPTQYCPASSTTREQMAVFVLVAKEGAGYVPPACATPMFADVPASSPFCRWIEELARRAVASGCGGGNYCPTSAVTREQMAVFVLRTLDPSLSPPACTTPIYNDVPASSPFCRWIEELTRRSVVTGCGGGNYCPTAAVTREQMGVFISVTFGLTLYGP